MLIKPSNRNPQKKYCQTGASEILADCPKTMTGVRALIHQVQKTTLAIISVTDDARGMRLGSRTAGSFRGSHSSRNPVLALERSSTANTIVTTPKAKKAASQN